MANLGYFQLKARPGAWRLQIREGRSKDIYTISGLVVCVCCVCVCVCVCCVCVCVCVCCVCVCVCV